MTYASTEQTRQYHRDRYRDLLEEIERYKLEQGCADCGYKEHSAALEFDHVRGVKKANVAQLVGRGRKVVFEEISKCDVVCANCHNIRTHNRRSARARS